MNKQEFFMLVGALIFSISLFAKANKEKQLSDLALKNVEALSFVEPRGDYTGDDVYYEWDGTHWNGKKDGTVDNWFPEFRTCDHAGSPGHQVVCVAGNGNCWNGTSCIKD